MAEKKTEKKRPTLSEWVGSFPTQSAAAKAIGCEKETLNRWINEPGRCPDRRNLEALEKLGVDVSEFRT